MTANGGPAAGDLELVRVRRPQRGAGAARSRVDERHRRCASPRGAWTRSSGSRRCAIRAASRCCARGCSSSRLGDRRRRRRRRGRRDRHRRRPADRLLRPGRPVSSAARWASATPTRSCACCRRPSGPGSRWSAFVESGGARMQEGTAALAGYGRIFRQTVALTGVVPQISVVSGASAGGGAYSPGADRPDRDDRGRGDVPDRPGRGARGARRGDRRRRARRPARARAQRRLPPGRARRGQRRRARARAARLPARRPPATAPPRAPAARPRAARSRRGRARPSRAAPTTSATRLAGIVDARLAAGAVPALGAQRGHRAGPDRRAARSGSSPTSPATSAACSTPRARRRRPGSSRFCNSFGLPLIAVVDTPGFMPGSRQEQAGVIRHGASLVRAFAAARVPKLTVVLRKSYGGAYITMNSRDLGADLVLAWPDAELGIMSARAAVGIVNRRELRAGRRPRGRARPPGRRLRPRAPAAPMRPPRPASWTRSSSRPRRATAWPARCARSPAAGDGGDPGGQAPADHRRHHQGLDRLPRRRAGAGGGRRRWC